jgi:hypothetical protein
MPGAIHPLPQYAFMAWCSVKTQGHLYLLPLQQNFETKYTRICTLYYRHLKFYEKMDLIVLLR